MVVVVDPVDPVETQLWVNWLNWVRRFSVAPYVVAMNMSKDAVAAEALHVGHLETVRLSLVAMPLLLVAYCF